MIFRVMALIVLCAIYGSAMGSERSTIEDVALHDGRHLKVERTVRETIEFKIRDPFFGLPVLPRTEAGGPIFSLGFIHPDTQETITWQSEQYYTPVLLDIVNGVPYLVVIGFTSKETEAIYGCPELPYFYLRYETGFLGKWVPIPVEKAPDVLRISNLSLPRRNDGGFFQRVIPRSYEEWNYSYKNNHRNERKLGDCRPPLKPLPDISLPTPIDVELEATESKDYIVKSEDENYAVQREIRGTITNTNCTKFFRPPDPENLMRGEKFVNDPSGNKRLPYSGPTPFPSARSFEKRIERYCDDNFIWFVAGHEEPGKTIITKYSNSGDFLYSIRIVDPELANIKLSKKMVRDSITAENGYFYFWWYQDLPHPPNSPMVSPYRMTKFRFREPSHETASK